MYYEVCSYDNKIFVALYVIGRVVVGRLGGGGDHQNYLEKNRGL